ncbi:hypothetical protein [Spiroplasma sp. AdecLV25b]|uniref:hypothetical protein n=1 Tax=Spiroplasma sp. AdecLV25b TaxID=3027162 RepID=UPI0027E01CA9|nr:hypothetical protein [Spiroplasma sp. AdecLV25b]
MIFVNISPLFWDLIVVGILVFGLVTGLFIGGRALVFISCGNLLAIGLMLVFKSLLLGYFKVWILPLFNNLDANFTPFRNLLVDNIGFIVYVIVWITGVNFLFWAIYLLLRLTILKKYKIKHKGINATFGAIINLARMSVVGALLIVMMSTSIFGNKTVGFGINKNEIPENSFMYKFFGGIDNNIPFFNLLSSDINTMIAGYQNNSVIKAAGDGLIAATNYGAITNLRMVIVLKTDENFTIDKALEDIKAGGQIDFNKQIIANTLSEHLINSFLDIQFMTPLLLAFQHTINLYPETSQALVNDLKDVPKIATTAKYKLHYNELKPFLINFISAINNSDAKSKVVLALEQRIRMRA